MARTKRAPASSLADPATSTALTVNSWLQKNATSRASKCALCGAEFQFLTPDEIKEHDFRCGSELPDSKSKREHEALQYTGNDDLAPVSPAPGRESSSRLTTPPESPVLAVAIEEGSVADFADLENNGVLVDPLDDNEEAQNSDVDDQEAQENEPDEREGEDQDPEDDEGENGSVIVKDDLISSVSAYVGEELVFYEFESVRPASESRELAESLATPELPSTNVSESLDDLDQGDDPLPPPTTKSHGFRKMTDLKELQKFLENPEEMSYEMLYHRTAAIADVLQQYSNEFKASEKEVRDFMVSHKSEEKRLAKDRTRLEEEAKDAVSYRLYELYYTKMKALAASKDSSALDLVETTEGVDATEDIDQARDVDTPDIDADPFPDAAPKGKSTPAENKARRYWQGLAEKLLESYPKDENMKKELAELMYGTTLNEMLQRRKEQEATSVEKSVPSKHLGVDLIDVPPEPLDKETLALYATRQQNPSFERILSDFEMQKMADVYGLPLVNGNVDLRDRNGGQPREGRNGRPMRAVRQVAKYDTEQSDAPGTSSEELPSKRRRNSAANNSSDDPPPKRQRKIVPAAESPAPTPRTRTARGTREESVQKTFESGKLIGRPRGSKTKAKAAESKLKESHLPLISPTPEADLQKQELPSQKNDELQDSVHSLLDQSGTVQEKPAPPKKGKHGGARIKGVSMKNGGIPIVKLASRSKRVKKEVAKKSALGDVEQNEVIPSTEHDDESRFASASVSRPTTSSSAGTAVSVATRRSTRQSTREKSKATENSAKEVEEPAKPAASEATKKRKRAVDQESIQVDIPESTEITESKELPTRKKQKTITPPPPPPKKSARQGKTTATKATKKPPAKKAQNLGNGMMVFPVVPEEVLMSTESAETEASEAEVKTAKKPRGAKAKAAPKRKKATPKAGSANDTEAGIKAKEKSAKLSASIKQRWASGQMGKAMEKRQKTLDAKKLAKKAAKAAQSAEPDSTHPSESVEPTPTSAPHVPPPINTSAPSSGGTRKSDRKRKPTSRARGAFDGADDDSESEDDVRPFKSEYEHFQALSSPGTPALPKRKSRQLYNLASFVGSEEEDSY